MAKQIVFSFLLLVTVLFFGYTVRKLLQLFRLTKSTEPLTDYIDRFKLTVKVAFGQTKILRKPFIGLMHALVFWGFLVITLGSIEMVIDGVMGTERIMGAWGFVYNVIIASGDVFAYVVAIGIVLFLIRRLFLNVKRFYGVELTSKNKLDANIALTFILLLMVTLAGMNISYVAINQTSVVGVYPISSIFASTVFNSHMLHELFWWSHILLIFVFANYLPYSKHFHVFMSVPNVFASNLNPLTQLPNMQSVTNEVKLMLGGNPFVESNSQTPVRFGVKDVEDVTWKNYMDSLTCTQCGRCTEVCPASITGKKLSPRKIFVDLRARMNEKGPSLIRDVNYADNKSLINDYISSEEIWACTTCNACAQECPLNISHPNLIIDMRRYLVLEAGKAPAEINTMFTNIENNGAPWQFSPEDRLEWTRYDD